MTVEAEQKLQDCKEYNYLTAIAIRLFEDTESEVQPRPLLVICTGCCG